MKFAPPDNRRAVSVRRLTLTLAAAALVPILLYGSSPSWWLQRGVLVENSTADDYAPVNQGQLKNIAKSAVAEMDAKLTGGAGNELHDLIQGWSSSDPATNDFAPVNLGQLKNVARLFYDRLIFAGVVDHYPWQTSLDSPDDFAVANIGQVKNLFSFDIPGANLLQDPLGDRIAAGEHSANLALESNAVWSWSSNSGLTPDFERNYPRRVPGLSGMRSVSSGDHHLVALGIDGRVFTWGENNAGQLGDGTYAQRDAPDAVPILTNIISVKAGGRHTLALQQDGTVVGWGDNHYGQLGTGDTLESATPKPVPGLDGIRKIATGYDRSAALKHDGTVWTWGYDRYDQRALFNPFPALVPDLSGVIDIAAGLAHTLAVKADGTVWAWGSNHANQIANGHRWWEFQDTPFQVPNLSNIVKVASSYDHNLALAADGTVWAWGDNFFGQLGDGTTQAHQAPVQVSGLTDVIAIATGYSYSLAMKADGTVWAWGDGATGTLPGVDLRVPQQVALGLLDTNQNGLDDRWELQFLGNLDQSAEADFDGDGISNRQEFLRRTDPADYFNGNTPVIEIAGGNNQIGDAGTFLGKPFKVRVRNPDGQLLVNAPVKFSIVDGAGALAITVGGSQQQNLLVRTNMSGEAAAYHALPAAAGTSSRTTVTAGKLSAAASTTFRGIVRLTPPPAPPPSPPPPGGTPTPAPSPTATPITPYRYAIIDLGKDMYPIRINNHGHILVEGYDSNTHWSHFRWKGGVLEKLNYAGPSTFFNVQDMNDAGAVVGYLRNQTIWKFNAENEIQAGLFWPADNPNGIKISAPSAHRTFEPIKPGSIRHASLGAINNANGLFGVAWTGTVRGFLNRTIAVMNSHMWPNASSPTQLSDATAINNPADSETSDWQGSSDAISRANSDGHYIGRKFIPFATSAGFLQGTETGMVDGQSVSFDPVDINEAGIVVGSAGADMIVSSSPNPQATISGASPLAINDHTRPAPSPSPQASPGPSPSPTPIPVPQILGWAGNALTIWERREDGQTWHPFGLEEMIPSMDGWQYLEPYDMNDHGAIVGIGWYTDPSDPKAEGEYHAFLLVPVELMDNNKRAQDSLIIPKQDVDERNEKSVAWIEPHADLSAPDAPVMPQLVLRFPGTETMELKIKWKLKVEHKRRNGRVVSADTALIPTVGENGDQPWNEELLDGALEIYTNPGWTNELQQNGFFGGNAELTYQLLKSDGTTLGGEWQTLFYIGGKNPDDPKCQAFITQTATQVQQPMAWFAYAIAKHESKDYNGAGSRYNQFWDKAGRFGGVDHEAGEVLWVNNPGEEPPKGFGLFQVTGNVAKKQADIPRKQLWNWQDNVRAGLAIVASKRGIADRYFARIQKRSAQHKTAFQECLPPSIPVGPHTFSSADAIQIYGYNGTGRGIINVRYPFDPSQPCGLGASKRWFWNPHNVAGGEPYIKKVERELEN